MGNPHNVPLFSMDFKSNSSQSLVMISLERILLHYPKDGQFKLAQCMSLILLLHYKYFVWIPLCQDGEI